MSYEHESEILAVVEGFESCATDKTAFKHREHLTVAVVYLQELSVAAAAEKMREALLAFLDHHGVAREKYSESVTLFWLEQVSSKLADLPTATLLEKCNVVVDTLGPDRTTATPVER